MHGSDSLIEDDLYEGTAKSAEGFLAAVSFKKANDEGCSIEINWQDQDSSHVQEKHSSCKGCNKCGSLTQAKHTQRMPLQQGKFNYSARPVGRRGGYCGW